MKRTTRIAIGLGTALSLGLAAAVVNAHPYGYGPGPGMGEGPGYGMGYGGGRGMGSFGPGHGNPAAAVEGRLAYFKAELKITAAQEPAWKKFSDQARQQAEAMQSWRAAMQSGATATAVERMELRNQFLKKRQEQSEKMTSAFKDLYASLTPEQKALADQHPGRGPGFGPGFGGGPGARQR